MLRRYRLLVAPLLAFVLLATNFYVFTVHRTASAHSWGGYHWDKGGGAIYIYQWQYASYFNDAEAARLDAWGQVWSLYNYRTTSHTNVDVFDGNWGNTGWGGLAEISLGWDWGCWCYNHITHGHARVNMYYGYNAWHRQRIFCQEVFHTYGFDHDETNGCMDYTYTTNLLVQHNEDDFNAKYRNH